jgi:signal transduction histidine kinase/CHASE2 domain-containing sensor protein
MRNIWNRFIRTENVFLAALLVSTTILLVQQGWLWRLDQYLYDAQLKLWQRPLADDIVIVTVDKNSLDKLGKWPWPASYYSPLLSQLAQDNPRAVLFYFPLPLSDSITQKPETELFVALRGIKNAALPVDMDQYAGIMSAGELSDYLSLYSIASTGHINVIQDQDGIVRSTYLAEGNPARLWNNLNLQVSGQTYDKPVIESDDNEIHPPGTSNEQQYTGYDRILIPFAGPPGHFQRIPFYKTLTGEIYPGEFNNKYVLIGVTDASIGRSYPTPNNGFTNPMSLVEINANILDSILNRITIKPVDLGWELAFSGIFALLPFLVFPFFTPRGNVIVTLALVTMALTTSLILVFYFYLWLPPSTALVALVLSYLLWSSRRLANAVHYLNKELTHLNAGQTYFETTINSSLDSVFSFLDRILPIAGWQITDSNDRLITMGGNPPDLSNRQFIRDRWSDDGIDYWTSLVINERENRIGIRWSNSSGPSANQKDYLDRLLRQFTDKPEKKENDPHEVVQNLIRQVQEAIINLRNTHKFLDDSLAHMADGILVTNEIGRILLVNSRAVTYLQCDANDDLIGKDILQLLSRITFEGSVKVNNLLGDSILNGLPVTAHASNEAGRDLLLQITPLSQGDTETCNVILNLSDISHLKSVERARNETLSFVSHDLRSPLVSILALLELAKNRDSSEEIRILHKRIEDYAQLTISLAEQFIQLARVESDASIKFDIIDLVSIAINAHEQTWVQAQSKDIQMIREIDLDHAWVLGDSGLLERAVTNLLNNAIKYSAAGCSVSMKIFLKNGHVWCCVQDEGYGIPESEIPTLFERFRRAHLNSGVDQEGTGLGLALVKATAERHGGYVDVQTREGEGSRFCLVLPGTGLNA